MKQHAGGARVTRYVSHYDATEGTATRLPAPVPLAQPHGDAERLAEEATASKLQPPVPPMDLTQRRTSGPGRRLPFGRWTSGQLRWLGPAAAVITVLAVTATALLLRGADNGSVPASAATIETSVPPYYVALISATPPASSNITTVQTVATVRATATGSEVASVAPPAPYTTFLSVSGATGDRTFVLLAVRRAIHPGGLRPERFYLLHVDPHAASAADRTRLTALPASWIPVGEQVAAMTLAPNGTNLAALLNSGGNPNVLNVYNLQTGLRRRQLHRRHHGLALPLVLPGFPDVHPLPLSA